MSIQLLQVNPVAFRVKGRATVKCGRQGNRTLEVRCRTLDGEVPAKGRRCGYGAGAALWLRCGLGGQRAGGLGLMVGKSPRATHGGGVRMRKVSMWVWQVVACPFGGLNIPGPLRHQSSDRHLLKHLRHCKRCQEGGERACLWQLPQAKPNCVLC